MQIPILSGIAVEGEFRTEYPVNLIPVPKATGISDGYLAPAHGIVAMGAGRDRGGIEWRGALYRVLGERLSRVLADGSVQDIGPIPGTDRAVMAYGFDHLAICANGDLFLYDGLNLLQVTDPDLGTALSVEWIDGYFLTTDGEFLVVTELNDPFQVNPLKYGSSEADPDPVVNVLRLRSEVYAVNRHTIEVFANVGGNQFPFDRIRGAQIQRGAVGRDAVCVFSEALAFIGSGQGEAISIYAGQNGGAAKLATREIDQILSGYTEAELSGAVLETMTENAHQFLIVRLPRETLVYDNEASAALQMPVWFRLASSLNGEGRWLAQNLVWCYGRWNVGHPVNPILGYLSRDVFTHWGARIGWRFTTPILYGESRAAVMHELELVALTGRAAIGDDPTIYAQYSVDGVEWSVPRWIKAGRTGDRTRRLSWRNLWRMRNWMAFRISGTSDAPLSMARLEARVEALAY
jgi:hypothetical protein